MRWWVAARRMLRTARSVTPGAADAAAAPPPAPRGTLPHILLHHAPHGLPTARVAFADVRVTPDDLLASERLLAAYQRSSAEQRTLSRLPANDVWEIYEVVP
jgi:hypothetical protein